MKLIIQIPCFNEEKTIAQTLADLPKFIDGVDAIEYLIIDDGSIDATVNVAKSSGAHHVLSLGRNLGLAKAFSAGIDKCLSLDADIIVNTDADNQYKGSCIAKIVKPILDKQADIVIGCRNIENIHTFSPLKKRLQRLGSRVVRKISGTDVSDATSGFRAYSRKAALRTVVVSRFTYTLETIIQAGQRGLRILCVDIEVNPPTRPSRLFRSTSGYIFRSLVTMLLVSTQFRPLWTFFSIGLFSIFLGLIPSIRFLVIYLQYEVTGRVQSLVMAAIFLLFGATCCLIGLVAEQVASNRRILEETMANLRQLKYGMKE